jgi:hypothetical protein
MLKYHVVQEEEHLPAAPMGKESQEGHISLSDFVTHFASDSLLCRA